MKGHGRQCLIIDANMEGLKFLLNSKRTAEDTWSRRASSHLDENLASIKNGQAFKNISSYTKAVREISRILEVNSQACATQVTLTNFQHETLSPVRSARPALFV